MALPYHFLILLFTVFCSALQPSCHKKKKLKTVLTYDFKFFLFISDSSFNFKASLYNKAEGEAHTAQKSRAIALPLSRAARAVRPNERAPLRGRVAKPPWGGARRSGEHRRRRAQQGDGRN